MSGYPTEVVDEHGGVHILNAEPLGVGGQGVVFGTKNPDIAVKLITQGIKAVASELRRPLLNRLTDGFGAPLARGDEAQRKLRARLEAVRTLHLPEGIRLAHPLAMLRGHTGYTMGLLRGMVAIRTLVIPPGQQNTVVAYNATGGLRRRLRLLAKTAETLGRLHAVPLIYADVSPNNIFISSGVGGEEAWLIDADNLHYQSTPGPAVFTPGFGAPEIVSGRGALSTLSDVFAFAVVAFFVMAQNHPFLGKQVEDAGDWAASIDPEEQAYAGALPWIEDEHDDSNSTETGIPRHMILTPRMRRLFQQTFGPGRQEAISRPSMLEWVEVLYQAADLTVCCRACGSTYFVPMKRCPWCEAAPEAELLYAEFRVWDPEFDADTYEAVLTGPPVWRMCIDLDQPMIIPRHAAEPSIFRDGNPPVLEVEVTRRAVRLTPQTEGMRDDRPIWAFVPHENRTELVDGTKELPLPVPGREWHLHFGPESRPHRIATFKLIRGLPR
jgi:hypothetical protein